MCDKLKILGDKMNLLQFTNYRDKSFDFSDTFIC